MQLWRLSAGLRLFKSVSISSESRGANAMRCLTAIPLSIRHVLAAGALLCAFCVASVSQTQQGQTQQNIMLKDPTPRPPDLQKQYGGDPADQARQQQAALVRNALIREQVVKTTGKLCLLAEQLRDDVAKGSKDTPAGINAAKAAQIEKLAKNVKDQMRMQ